MEFCNKGMVRADPPPVMVKDHKITMYFLGPFPYSVTFLANPYFGYCTNYFGSSNKWIIFLFANIVWLI